LTACRIAVAQLSDPKGWTPDFAISPILGPLDSEIELLELKGPCERILTGGTHRGFSAKVKRAIDQVKDYDRCLHNPANHRAIFESFGYVPEKSSLAVLIGRDPDSRRDKKARLQRQSEIDVEVITYDEILATQIGQLKSCW
jgi:antiviral defense system Shedu protein SduA